MPYMYFNSNIHTFNADGQLLHDVQPVSGPFEVDLHNQSAIDISVPVSSSLFPDTIFFEEDTAAPMGPATIFPNAYTKGHSTVTHTPGIGAEAATREPATVFLEPAITEIGTLKEKHDITQRTVVEVEVIIVEKSVEATDPTSVTQDQKPATMEITTDTV